MSISDLYTQKWHKFQKRIWLFKFIPFVDFVLAAGSLATGRVNGNSDFDVIVGARQGRIFTTRFFCWLIFGAIGWRASHSDKSDKSDLSYKDKFCFNHFLTPNAYRLSPPYNEYWENLYQKLIPVYGEPGRVQDFFDANADWIGPIRPISPIGLIKPIGLIGYFEKIFSARFGNWLEKMLKAVQIAKIKKGLKFQTGYKSRIIYNDNELEFHPDTKRIEEYIEKINK